METKPLCLQGSDWSMELLVLELDGREWLVASEIAKKLMRWNLSTLRRELNQRDWDKMVVRDRAVLLLLAERGLLGDSLPGHKRTVGHARSANLVALESLPNLLLALQPKWTEGHDAVVRALDYPNIGGNNLIETYCDDNDNEEEVYDWGGNENGTSLKIASSRPIDELAVEPEIRDIESISEEEDKESSNDENQDPSMLAEGDQQSYDDPSDNDWRYRFGPHRNKLRQKCYNYSLPVGKQCARLKRQISEFKDFLTLPIVMQRQTARVENSTLKNAISCALRYLGYCYLECRVSAPTLDEFKNIERLQNYFDWLLYERSVQAQTIDHYLNTAISVLKFLHRDEASPNNRYKDITEVETLRQVRRQIRGLVRFEPPSHEQLSRMKKWLPWDQIVKTLSLLKSDYEACIEYSAQKARSLMEYLMIALYVYFPPVRARPIRQLAIGKSLIKINGAWHLDLRKYKTFKVYGPVITQIHDELVGPLEEYLKIYRPLLLKNGRDHSFVFANRSGEPFTTSAWTYTIQSIFRRKTGQTIGTTLLRDSFVTYVYGQDLSQELKESIALHMGHRVDTAKRVYDRRTSAERRQAGINFASSLVQQIQNTQALPSPEQMQAEETFISLDTSLSPIEESRGFSDRMDCHSGIDPDSPSKEQESDSEQSDIEQCDSDFERSDLEQCDSEPCDSEQLDLEQSDSNTEQVDLEQCDSNTEQVDLEQCDSDTDERNTSDIQSRKRTSRQESFNSNPIKSKRSRRTPVPWWQQSSTTNHACYYWEGVQMLE